MWNLSLALLPQAALLSSALLCLGTASLCLPSPLCLPLAITDRYTVLLLLLLLLSLNWTIAAAVYGTPLPGLTPFLLPMACRCPTAGSYTVVIIPLKTSLYSLDALRFYLWIKRLKDLEQEKDALWCGLEILDKARLWYLQRLEENKQRQDNIAPSWTSEADSCLLRSRIQRANGSLGSVMNEPNVTCSSAHSLPEAVADSDLRWRNTVLTKEVSGMNHQISLLQMEKDALLEQLEDQRAH